MWISNIQESGLSQVASCRLPLVRARHFNKTELRHSESPVFLLLQTGWVPLPNWRLLSGEATWLIEWLCSLAGTGKVKTMKLYLAGIKSYQIDLGIECAAFADPRLERMIQGIKCDDEEPECRI